MIKAVIWDIGGVILTDPKVGDFWKNKEDSKELRKKFGSNKISIDDFVSEGSKLLGMNEKDFLDSYKKAYFSIEPIQEVLEIYENMKTDKYILSDTNPLHLEFIKKNYASIFNQSKKNYFSPELGLRKDDRKIFEYLIENLKLPPEEVLFIDNKKRIVDLAKETGLNVIHFTNAEKLKEDLEKYNIK